MTGTKYTIRILSDSLGETADLVARAATSQYEPGTFVVVRSGKISSSEELRTVLDTLCDDDSCVVFHTFADPTLRAEMELLAPERGIPAVDIMGPPVAALACVSGQEPHVEPGAIRKTDRDYYERIDAMEFAVKHDDGRNPEGLTDAEVVLVGVSRTSKTPLSMYIAGKGYKVANVPLVYGVDPPKELFDVQSNRVFGLVSDPALLSSIRGARLKGLGGHVRRYADREAVEREMETARDLMRRLGAIVIRTDNRAVEETAQEIIRYLES